MIRKNVGVTLLVCSLLASGLLAVGVVATTGTSDDGTTTLGVDDTTTNLVNMTVYANVQGHVVPIEGANITVYQVTVESNDTTMVVTYQKVAELETGEGGSVQVNLTSGNYTVVAEYYGLTRVIEISIEADTDVSLILNAGLCDPGEFQRHLGMGPKIWDEKNDDVVSDGNTTMEMILHRLH